jgi:uracil permease
MAVKDWIADYKLGYQDHLFSVQILLVAFGALVTVPVLTGLDPAVALFTAGVGTLIFHFFTKRLIPVFLASSFAYTAPIMVATKTWGLPATLGGLIAAGFVYMVIGAIIYWKGRNIIQTLFPPIVVGPVIMVLGLMLAPVAVSMALGKSNSAVLIPEKVGLLVAAISLATTILIFLLARGTLQLIPVICGLIAGYLVSIPFGIIDFSILTGTPWIALPKFVLPQFNPDAVVFLIPAAVAPLIAHFGDIIAIGEVADKDYLKEPGIHRTLLGTGAASAAAAFIGGPPIRIYAEITGAVTVFKRWRPAVMVWAALFAMMLAFMGKLSALCLLKVRSDLMEFRNIVVVVLILISGIGGITFSAGAFTLKGVALATLTGVILNLVFPEKKIPQEP